MQNRIPYPASPLIWVIFLVEIIPLQLRLTDSKKAVEAGLHLLKKGGLMTLCIYSGGDDRISGAGCDAGFYPAAGSA